MDIKVHTDAFDRSRAILHRMLSLVETYSEKMETEPSVALLCNEKDSLLSAHSRIIQLIVKLTEAEIRFEQESIKLKKMTKELDESIGKADEEMESLQPLEEAEWEALLNAIDRRNQEPEEVKTENSNYAVLLK